MLTDRYSQIILTEDDLCDLYMRDPTRIVKSCLVTDNINLDQLFLSADNTPELVTYVDPETSVEDFDECNQDQWQMP